MLAVLEQHTAAPKRTCSVLETSADALDGRGTEKPTKPWRRDNRGARPSVEAIPVGRGLLDPIYLLHLYHFLRANNYEGFIVYCGACHIAKKEHAQLQCLGRFRSDPTAGTRALNSGLRGVVRTSVREISVHDSRGTVAPGLSRTQGLWRIGIASLADYSFLLRFAFAKRFLDGGVSPSRSEV